ncbi:MAG: NAD(P)H-hydrate epimerase [Anaerolineae bacterium]|nr:NAD(P)H-hydrate epimerase [Anaerolineae bacterium]
MQNDAALPALTTTQMAEVDRLMIEDYGILLIQMMENAGRNLAEMAGRILGDDLLQREIVILCGGGNNGGGGMVAARHLHNRGAHVQAKLVGEPARLKDIPAHQWQILKALGVTAETEPALDTADLVIDAMIGYGLSGDPRGPVADWIRKANAARRPVLALDAPSGLDTTTGIPGTPCILAAATLTLALPKTGLLSKAADAFVGDLFLADISVPPELYERLGLYVAPIFTADAIVRVKKESDR